MKGRIAFLLGLAAFLITIPADEVAAASKRIKPTSSAGSLSIRIAGKNSGYDKATRWTPVEFRVKGPKSVRLLSRYMFSSPPADDTEVTYRLRVEIDAATLPTATEKATVSTRARLPEGGRVGTLERTILRIPDGDHKVRVYPLERDATIALRVLSGSGKKSKISWTSFAPETHAGALRLHGGDTEYTYYRFNQEEAVAMTIHGPLRLKMTTRLDFGTGNGYTQAYVVKIFLDGELWKTYPLESRASHTSTYPDYPEITPGRGRILEVEIPDGTHEVSITLNGTTAAGAALRIRVPKKDLQVG